MDFGETEQEILEIDEKTRLLSRIWLPEGEIKAIFLAIHGGLAHAGDWALPALYFKERAVATYALDLRHHGTYPQYNRGGQNYFHINSYRQYSEDIDFFYNFIRKQHPDLPIFIIAHSNGGLITLDYLLTLGQERDIRGAAISSPWLNNLVPINPVLDFFANIIAFFNPLFQQEPTIALEELTHDGEVVKRHHRDEKLGLRGTAGTVKLYIEAKKCQKRVLKGLKSWSKVPLFAAIAGEDRLADPAATNEALKAIPPELLTLHNYPGNYHENFNELNREEIFGLIWKWLGDKI